MFSAPAGLSILAKLDERLDFLPLVERIILKFKTFSMAFWSFISSIINVDLTFVNVYLSFLALSFIPVILSVRMIGTVNAFPYMTELARRKKEIEARHRTEIKEIEEYLDKKFHDSTGENRQKWNEKIKRESIEAIEEIELIKSLEEIKSTEIVGESKEFDPEMASKKYEENKKIAERRRKSAEKRREERRREQENRSHFETQLRRKLDDLSKEAEVHVKNSKINCDMAKKNLKVRLIVKFLLSLFSCIAIFIVFEIVYSVFIAIASIVFIWSLWNISSFVFRLFEKKGNTFFDYLAVPMLLAATFGGYGFMTQLIAGFFDIDLSVQNLIIVSTAGSLSLISFFVVISFRIFAYLYYSLWALGMFIVNETAERISPAISSWLDVHGI
ncbi:hypothetical protein SAMN05421720_13012 [Rhodospira trueperi]|uniref:Uncharacterized protein n=2 Tax=Rhodospira trueperi TaxID=69960 RepID=A0A1G7I4S6_9PROT|nr:hypothetical protein SAMN05421720_13012 [Rhodospira trueperi]